MDIKRMKRRFFIFLILLFILCKCGIFYPVNSLSKEDKVWASPYEEGDTVLFKSQNDVDTLIIKTHYIEYYYWPFVSPEGNELNDEYIYTSGKLLHNSDSLDCIFSAKKRSNYLELYLCLDFRLLDFFDSRQIKWKRLAVNGDTLHDVICIDNSNSHYYQGHQLVANDVMWYYWSKSKGLIKYRYYSGDIYSLVEKRKRK